MKKRLRKKLAKGEYDPFRGLPPFLHRFVQKTHLLGMPFQGVGHALVMNLSKSVDQPGMTFRKMWEEHERGMQI